MLLVEWQAWWAAIPALEAHDWYESYVSMLVSDPGWKLDRDTIIQHRRELAATADPRHEEKEAEAPDPKDPWGLRRQVRRVFAWLSHEYGPLNGNEDGFGQG